MAITLASIISAITTAIAAAPTVEALIADVEQVIGVAKGTIVTPTTPGAASLAAMVASDTAAAEAQLETPIK
jgi:hypothetical protein